MKEQNSYHSVLKISKEKAFNVTTNLKHLFASYLDKIVKNMSTIY